MNTDLHHHLVDMLVKPVHQMLEPTVPQVVEIQVPTHETISEFIQDEAVSANSKELKNLEEIEYPFLTLDIKSNPLVEQFKRMDVECPQEVNFSASSDATLELHQFLSELKREVPKAAPDVLVWTGSGEVAGSGENDDLESFGDVESGQEDDPETLVVWDKVSQVRNSHNPVRLEPPNLLPTSNPDIPKSVRNTISPSSKVLSHKKTRKKA